MFPELSVSAGRPTWCLSRKAVEIAVQLSEPMYDTFHRHCELDSYEEIRADKSTFPIVLFPGMHKSTEGQNQELKTPPHTSSSPRNCEHLEFTIVDPTNDRKRLAMSRRAKRDLKILRWRDPELRLRQLVETIPR